MSDKLLKIEATTGMFWSVIQRFSQMGVQLVSSIILARLLTPDDFGTIGLLSIFILLSNTFMDGGFGSALIQKKKPNPEDYSTIFWWNLGMSLMLYIVLFLSAPFIAEFYRMEVLCKVLRIHAIGLIIGSFTSIQANILQKSFKFKKIAIITLCAHLLSLTVTIIFALSGYGVWSLVAQSLICSSIISICYWYNSSWRPKLIFSKKSFKELGTFGIFILSTNVINVISNNIQGLLIGRFFNASTMGFYSKAKNTEMMASTSLSSSINQVTYPLYSALQNDKTALINTIKKITTTVAFVTFPLMLLLMIIGKSIFVFLYSDRWLESVPYFQILCIAGIAQCLQAANLQPLNAIGKSKTTFSWNLIKQVFGVSITVCGLCFGGMKGLLICMVINSWQHYIVNALLVSKHIGYKVVQQIKDLIPILVLSVVALIVSIFLGKILILPLYIDAILKGGIYLFVYYAGVRIFKIEAYNNFINMLPLLTSKFKKNKK